MNHTASPTDSHDSQEPAGETKSEPAAPSATGPEPAPQAPTDTAAIEETDRGEPTAEELLEQARQEATAAKEAHLRAVADLENFRRRTAREKNDLRAFAAANVVEELLPVLDNLGLALVAARADNAELTALVDGVEMVSAQFKGALGNHGLKEINPAGEDFDPNRHEAISQQSSDEVAEGKVIQVVRVGYSLNGRLIRPANVIVSGDPGSEATAPDDA